MDEMEVWRFGDEVAGSDSNISHLSYDQNYTPAQSFEQTEAGDGFATARGIAVDNDFNAFYITTNSPKLFRFSYENLGTKDLEVSIAGTNEGIAFDTRNKKLWIRFDDGNNAFLENRDLLDGSLVSTIGGGLPSEKSSGSGLHYSFKNHQFSYAYEHGAEQIGIVVIDPETGNFTQHNNLVPSTFSNNPSARSYRVDAHGNHYFVYFRASGDAWLIKYDSEFNLVWDHQLGWGGSVNVTKPLCIDLDQNVYIGENGGTNVYVRKIGTDGDGLNPSQDWRTLMISSGGDNPDITTMEAERKAGGAIFTGHETNGGVRKINKDGSGVASVLGKKTLGFVLLPGYLEGFKTA